MNFQDFLSAIPHKFNPSDTEKIARAFELCQKSHAGQTRKSGELYANHPISAAIIVGQIFPDPDTICATLLHDVPEDTTVELKAIEQNFGQEVAHLVDGVTKLGKVRLLNSLDEFYVENLRKMFIATSQDVRVMLVKLADRLHNMRTISALEPDKQQKIATETLEMYAPIAGRLGIGSWKDELENLSFKIVDPARHQEVETLLKWLLKNREVDIAQIENELTNLLQQEHIPFEHISGRVKRTYSLHKKLLKYDGDITKINDSIALRIITKSSGDCYATLGVIHQHYQPMPGKIKDFIAMPKPNGYQSLHTIVFGSQGLPFEIQIRTDLMHEEAERGVAAHWFYTEQGKSSQKQASQSKSNWVQELRAWQELAGSNPEEFLETLKIDFFQDRIFVLTPKGDVKDLPKGATCIDFAFALHTDLGQYMMGAKINGKMASIYDELEQGDVVEIIKSKRLASMSRDWLNSAKTRHARAKIRAFLKDRETGVRN